MHHGEYAREEQASEKEGAREREREREDVEGGREGVCSGSIYLNKTVGEKREREQGKRDKEICIHDWQCGRKSKQVIKWDREREGAIETKGERVNLPFAYFKWLQLKCSGSIYLNKTVGKGEKESWERDSEICMHDWCSRRE